MATIPAVIVGFLLEKLLRHAFGAPVLAAGFLIANGVMLFAAERMKGRQDRALSRLRWIDAVIIGCWQCLALIPGFSRSGATMAGGYLAGLNHEDAARFSFLTATPVILGATVLEAPKLLKAHDHFSGVAILAGVVAGRGRLHLDRAADALVPAARGEGLRPVRDLLRPRRRRFACMVAAAIGASARSLASCCRLARRL